MMHSRSPLALYGPDAQVLVSKLTQIGEIADIGFVPIPVPATARLEEVVRGLAPLGFLGLVVNPPSAELAKLIDRRTRESMRDGVADALVVHVHGSFFATHTLEDALVCTLERVGVECRGASAIVCGGGASAAAVVGLARLGVRTFVFVAPDLPAAERLAALVPAGLETHAMHPADPALTHVVERADLIFMCEHGVLDARLLGPYHTLVEVVDAAGISVALERVGGSVIPFDEVRKQRLALQLEFVSGIKIDPQLLG